MKRKHGLLLYIIVLVSLVSTLNILIYLDIHEGVIAARDAAVVLPIINLMAFAAASLVFFILGQEEANDKNT
jgi:hypothetical protein